MSKAIKNQLPTVQIVNVPHLPIYDRDEKIFRITPQQKAVFYEEVYNLYMEYLMQQDPERYESLRQMENYLKQREEGLGMILYVFKRIAPTLCNLEPLDFLHQALMSVEWCRNFNFICVFMQIAAFRWATLEKEFKQFAQSRVGREGNKWENTQEGKLIVPVFQDIFKSEKSFSDTYKSKIIPLLASHQNIWKDNIRKMLKNWRKERKSNSKEKIDTVNQYLMKMEAEEASQEFIAETLLKIPELKKQFQDKYRRWKDNLNGEPIFYFSSVDAYFTLSDMKERWWHEMPPWPIEDCKRQYKYSGEQIIEFVIQEGRKLSTP